MAKICIFCIPPKESRAEKHPEIFVRQIMELGFTISQNIGQNKIEKPKTRGDIEENLHF
jgi:hypothetical protein